MSASNRERRAAIARETLDIVAQGHYAAADGRIVEIGATTRACLAGTRLHVPGEPGALRSREARVAIAVETAIKVRDEGTLSSAARLAGAGFARVGVLNFASARHPGGGFERGSQAQEESLARSSSLHASLTTAAAAPYYRHHRDQASAAYSDRVIVSPDCPVFRDDDDALRDRPFIATFLTCAAPNARAMADSEPEALAALPALFGRRIEAVLAVALDAKCDALVLGAWGCGVFGNDPAMVADAFATRLGHAGAFRGAFRQIDFAVLDNSPGKACLAAFERTFGTHPR